MNKLAIEQAECFMILFSSRALTFVPPRRLSFHRERAASLPCSLALEIDLVIVHGPATSNKAEAHVPQERS